jgi:hypothetical protein
MARRLWVLGSERRAAGETSYKESPKELCYLRLQPVEGILSSVLGGIRRDSLSHREPGNITTEGTPAAAVSSIVISTFP